MADESFRDASLSELESTSSAEQEARKELVKSQPLFEKRLENPEVRKQLEELEELEELQEKQELRFRLGIIDAEVKFTVVDPVERVAVFFLQANNYVIYKKNHGSASLD